MKVSIHRQVLDNKFSTVDKITREICHDSEDHFHISSIDTDSSAKHNDLSLFNHFAKLVIPK